MEIKKWKILDREYLFKRPWLTARRDKVQLPDGRINPEYYVLEYPDWINVIAITKTGMFVMVEQYRHGLQDVFTELVGGVIEPGEDPLAAARRELRKPDLPVVIGNFTWLFHKIRQHQTITRIVSLRGGWKKQRVSILTRPKTSL